MLLTGAVEGRWQNHSGRQEGKGGHKGGTAAGTSQGTHLFLVAGFSSHGRALKYKDVMKTCTGGASGFTHVKYASVPGQRAE